MTRPAFLQWRSSSVPITNGATILLPQQTIKERQLAALSALAARMNPDGTTF